MEAKVIKEKSREYKGKPYYKFKINLPQVSLGSAGFAAGDILDIEAEKGKIVLKKKLN